MASKMHNVPPDVDFESSKSVKGLFSAEAPNSSFAEMRMGLITEPTHMEDEDEGQENDKEDERDRDECRVCFSVL